MGQEEAVCHTQSAFAQIDPESGGETRSWISPQKRREGFCEKAGRGGDQILANKESVKELILKKTFYKVALLEHIITAGPYFLSGQKDIVKLK